MPFIKREKGRAKGTRIKAIVAAITDILYWWLALDPAGPPARQAAGRVVAWDEN